MRELINKIGTFCVNRLAELVGIIIILASIFIFASLVTYSPEDPNFIFPENTLIKNLMGSKGSFISDLLFQSFGLVSLLIPFTFFFTGLSVAISKKFLSIIENSFFIILYILLACLFFSAFSEDSYWLIINGNNGFLGNLYNETYILNLVKSSENFSYYILIALILLLFLKSVNFKINYFLNILKKIFLLLKNKKKSEVIEPYFDTEENIEPKIEPTTIQENFSFDKKVEP